MTASSTTSNDLEKHDIIDVADTDTSNDLEKHDTTDAVHAKDHDAINTEKRPPAAEITADAFESPLQKAYQTGEWSNPQDPEDPLNWSFAKKFYHAAIPSIYCFTVYVEDTPVR